MLNHLVTAWPSHVKTNDDSWTQWIGGWKELWLAFGATLSIKKRLSCCSPCNPGSPNVAIPGTKWRFSSLVDFPASHRLKPVASPKFGGFAKCQRCLKMQYKWTPKKRCHFGIHLWYMWYKSSLGEKYLSPSLGLYSKGCSSEFVC